MSPNTIFALGRKPENTITERVLEHPRVTYDLDGDALVIAMKDELLVRRDARSSTSDLDRELSAIAHNGGSIGGRGKLELSDEVEIWRLADPDANSIDIARRLRRLAPDVHVKTRKEGSLVVPAISPNHVCVVAPKFDCCPASPPSPIPPPPCSGDFIVACEGGRRPRVTVIDTGYIHTDPPHLALDERVTSVAGEWFDTSVDPALGHPDAPDVPDADGDGRLDGVAGHGTFIAGIVAHLCPEAEITVVGQRHQCLPLDDPPNPTDQAMLFSSEFDIATALLAHADADVVSCGFAFPTLDTYASISFTSVMQVLSGPGAPRRGVAVVSPAGNEESDRAYWPAAHPDVIGVAATNRHGNARAYFSNWGVWADCCTRGQDVTSTFIYWTGPVDGDPLADVDDFVGWARWDGTSFSAPKVAAAIARLVAESDGSLEPIDAFTKLLSGTGGVTVTALTDAALTTWPVTLPHVHLG